MSLQNLPTEYEGRCCDNDQVWGDSCEMLCGGGSNFDGRLPEICLPTNICEQFTSMSRTPPINANLPLTSLGPNMKDTVLPIYPRVFKVLWTKCERPAFQMFCSASLAVHEGRNLEMSWLQMVSLTKKRFWKENGAKNTERLWGWPSMGEAFFKYEEDHLELANIWGPSMREGPLTLPVCIFFDAQYGA